MLRSRRSKPTFAKMVYSRASRCTWTSRAMRRTRSGTKPAWTGAGEQALAPAAAPASGRWAAYPPAGSQWENAIVWDDGLGRTQEGRQRWLYTANHQGRARLDGTGL